MVNPLPDINPDDLQTGVGVGSEKKAGLSFVPYPTPVFGVGMQ